MGGDVGPSGKKFAACNAHFDRCEVSLALYGEDLEPDVVTKRIGLEPTWAHRKGDRRTERAKPATVGSWGLAIGAEPPTLPSDLVRRLLERVPADAEFWAQLRRDYQVQIRFAFDASTLTGCFELEPDVAARLAATGATLAFHLYSHGG